MPTPIHLAAAAAVDQMVELRNASAFSASGVNVDPGLGKISNVSLMTAGTAIGHGFTIDGVMLQQTADAINAVGGVKSRLGHPPIDADGNRGDAIGQTVGTVSNARVDGDQVRGDVQLGDYAEHMPGGGNAKKYLTG